MQTRSKTGAANRAVKSPTAPISAPSSSSAQKADDSGAASSLTSSDSGSCSSSTSAKKRRFRPPRGRLSSISMEAEYEEDEKQLQQKVVELARLMRASKHTVIHAGAGISTASKIPDFRGPKGVWTLQAQGIEPDLGVEFEEAVPTLSHMALVELHNQGLVHYIVSQNVDGLFLRSGIRESMLSELHGNVYLETCKKCKRRYLRDFDAAIDGHEWTHETGRRCEDPSCGGKLVDSIVNFGEMLPELDQQRAEEHSKKADLSIVIGSSMKVWPASEFPLLTIDNDNKINKGKLAIINLQKTYLDKHAEVRIFGRCDNVFRMLMEELGLSIPVFEWYTNIYVCNTWEPKKKLKKTVKKKKQKKERKRARVTPKTTTEEEEEEWGKAKPLADEDAGYEWTLHVAGQCGFATNLVQKVKVLRLDNSQKQPAQPAQAIATVVKEEEGEASAATSAPSGSTTTTTTTTTIITSANHNNEQKANMKSGKKPTRKASSSSSSNSNNDDDVNGNEASAAAAAAEEEEEEEEEAEGWITMEGEGEGLFELTQESRTTDPVPLKLRIYLIPRLQTSVPGAASAYREIEYVVAPAAAAATKVKSEEAIKTEDLHHHQDDDKNNNNNNNSDSNTMYGDININTNKNKNKKKRKNTSAAPKQSRRPQQPQFAHEQTFRVHIGTVDYNNNSTSKDEEDNKGGSNGLISIAR